MFEQTEGQATWDQRIAFHQRLHQAILTAYRDMYNEDYKGWYKSLLSLKMSLYPHMEEDDKEEFKKLVFKCRLQAKRKSPDATHFVTLQEKLHDVMRSRSFDLPIVNRTEESILARTSQ